MICKDVLIEKEGKSFCLGSDNIIYTCKECNEKTKQCKDCIAIPKPRRNLPYPSVSNAYGYNTEEYGGMNQIMEMVKKKEFLFGVGAGLILGMLLFQR